MECSDTTLLGVRDSLVTYPCDTLDRYRFGRQISSVIYRTFVIADNLNNVDSCTQRIYLFRPENRMPECEVNLSLCEYPDVTAENAAEKLHPDTISSAPYYFNGAGEEVLASSSLCDYQIFHQEILNSSTDCSRELVRTWTIVDNCWSSTDYCGHILDPEAACTNAFERDVDRVFFNQRIVLEDTLAPAVEVVTEGLSFCMDAEDPLCESSFEVELLLTDDCAARGFQMPATGEATLRVQDISGRVLKTIDGIFEKGYNEIRLEGEDLPAVGMLFYTLETQDHKATKRMIRVQ